MHVKSHMLDIFSEYGWSDTLVSDNGSCYGATKYSQTMEDMVSIL